MKLPRYVWGLVAALCLAELLFWVSMLQVDMMFWSGWSYQEACDWIWVPELGISVKDFYEFLFCLAVVGFHIPIIVILWLLGEQLHLSKTDRNGLVGFSVFLLGLGVDLYSNVLIGVSLMGIGVAIMLWKPRHSTA